MPLDWVRVLSILLSLLSVSLVGNPFNPIMKLEDKTKYHLIIAQRKISLLHKNLEEDKHTFHFLIWQSKLIVQQRNDKCLTLITGYFPLKDCRPNFGHYCPVLVRSIAQILIHPQTPWQWLPLWLIHLFIINIFVFVFFI